MPLPTKAKRPWLLTADEAACALGGASGASIVLGAWSMVAAYTIALFGVVLWKARKP